jgi:hypothetical protein
MFLMLGKTLSLPKDYFLHSVQYRIYSTLFLVIRRSTNQHFTRVGENSKGRAGPRHDCEMPKHLKLSPYLSFNSFVPKFLVQPLRAV